MIGDGFANLSESLFCRIEPLITGVARGERRWLASMAASGPSREVVMPRHWIERTTSSAAARASPTVSTSTRPGLSRALYTKQGAGRVLHFGGPLEVIVNEPTSGPGVIASELAHVVTDMVRHEALTHITKPFASPEPPPPPPHKPASPNPTGRLDGT